MLRGKDFLLIIFGATIFSFALFYFFPQQRKFQDIISPLAQGLQETRNLLAGFTDNSLKEVVDSSLHGTRGTYAVIIKNLRTGEYFSQNEKRTYEPASLYKLWVLGAAYKQIKEGKLNRDEIINRDVKDLNEIFDIASDSAELTEGTVTMKISDAIEQMITISHNYAALLLVSKIRNSNVSAFMREQGFSSSRLGEPPRTTAQDIASFFEKLYEGAMVDGEYSKRMLDLLSRQRIDDRIPKYLPGDVDVAHKTGELGRFKHDAGIIFGKDPILLVVLSESGSPKGAAERIAELSRDIFNYFETK
ncbi:MAG: serine hydrolase [Candidatus Levybacteria bacterium]|nr:serine hydrolase [Candidatus Levybacteria bacterium]